MNRNIFGTLLIITLWCYSTSINAQDNTAAADRLDDLGDVSDTYKELFFKALSAKAIGNHDQAIQLLSQCDSINPNDKAVQFELAKNHFINNNLTQSQQLLHQALDQHGDDQWMLNLLYDIYQKQQDYQQSLAIMERLTTYDISYQEYLPSLYYKTRQYTKALNYLDVIDKRLGNNDQQRNSLRIALQQHLLPKQLNQPDDKITQLQQQIKQDPQNEQAYINLIYLYSQDNNEQGILQVAQQLQNHIATSDIAHLALYKVYIEHQQIDKAITSLKTVLTSQQIESETKIKTLQDFITAANNQPQLDPIVPQAIDWLSQDLDDPNAYLAIGDYYARNKQLDQAFLFYNQGLKLDQNHIELLTKTALVSIDSQKFKHCINVTNQAISTYPAQPIFYLLNAVAHNKLNQSDLAIQSIENGQQYLLDEYDIQRDMYLQLAIAYDQKNDATRANTMRKLAQELESKK